MYSSPMDMPLPPMNPEVARLRRQSAHRKYVKRLRYVRVLWAIAGVLLVALAAEVVTAVCISPRFWITHIDVSPGDTLTMPEVIRLLALPEHSNYYRARLKRLAARLEQQEPRIAHATVHRGSMGALVVGIQERQPACRLGLDVPPRYLDADNILFTRPGALNPPVPVVEGIVLPGDNPFGRVVGDQRVTAVAACLRAVAQVFQKGKGLDIARILVAPTGRMTLLLRQGTEIRLGAPVDFEKKMFLVQESIVYASNQGYSLDQLAYINATVPDRSAGLAVDYKPRTEIDAAPDAPKAGTP